MSWVGLVWEVVLGAAQNELFLCSRRHKLFIQSMGGARKDRGLKIGERIRTLWQTASSDPRSWQKEGDRLEDPGNDRC